MLSLLGFYVRRFLKRYSTRFETFYSAREEKFHELYHVNDARLADSLLAAISNVENNYIQNLQLTNNRFIVVGIWIIFL